MKRKPLKPPPRLWVIWRADARGLFSPAEAWEQREAERQKREAEVGDVQTEYRLVPALRGKGKP